MKKIIGFVFLGIMFIVFVIQYLRYDNKMYYYGYDCAFCNKNLPYNLEPKFNYEYPPSFVLLDEDGYELVCKGFRYETTNFKVNSFLAYGYNNNSIIAKTTDSLNNVKYLISYETGDKSKKGNPEISFKDLKNDDFKQIKDDYNWFQVLEEKSNSLKIMKILYMVCGLLTLLFIVIKLFRLKKIKATN